MFFSASSRRSEFTGDHRAWFKPPCSAVDDTKRTEWNHCQLPCHLSRWWVSLFQRVWLDSWCRHNFGEGFFCGERTIYGDAAYLTMHMVKWQLLKWCLLGLCGGSSSSSSSWPLVRNRWGQNTILLHAANEQPRTMSGQSTPWYCQSVCRIFRGAKNKK